MLIIGKASNPEYQNQTTSNPEWRADYLLHKFPFCLSAQRDHLKRMLLAALSTFLLSVTSDPLERIGPTDEANMMLVMHETNFLTQYLTERQFSYVRRKKFLLATLQLFAWFFTWVWRQSSSVVSRNESTFGNSDKNQTSFRSGN